MCVFVVKFGWVGFIGFSVSRGDAVHGGVHQAEQVV